MSKLLNPNLPIVREAARSLGATVLSAVEGRKHLKVALRTKAGATFNMSIQHGKVDAYLITGWLRQKVRRADARYPHR